MAGRGGCASELSNTHQMCKTLTHSSFFQEDTLHVDHWWLVVAAPLNFTHKAGCAAVLGAYGLHEKSWEQVILLLAFQVRRAVLVL